MGKDEEQAAQALGKLIAINIRKGVVPGYVNYRGIYCAGCDFHGASFPKGASCDKIAAACHAVQALDRVETALLQCGVSKESIPEILDRWNETRDHYALVLAGHLSFVLADHLAQTSLVQARTPFDRDSVPRAVGVLAQILNDARRNGHCGASVPVLGNRSAPAIFVPS